MSSKYLSLVELRQNVSPATLREVVRSVDTSARAVSAHHLLWRLFGDTPDRKRDFLWREHKPGVFYLLSDRPPDDRHELFDVREPREFTPSLTAGDALHFELRVNATIAKFSRKEIRGKRSDVVMDAMYQLKRTDEGKGRTSADIRKEVMDKAAGDWIEKQGTIHGFSVQTLVVQGYSVMELDRSRQQRARFGILDLSGIVTVTDATKFVAILASGLGRAKAFGCGLMMIRRA